MEAITRVDLHLHSIYSDGSLSPAALAERLGEAGVVCAALADHDSVEGLAEFRGALSGPGIGFITAAEITAQCGEAEAHLLAYGIDPTHPELRQTLRSLRRAREPDRASIAGALRERGAREPSVAGEATSAAPAGRLEIAEAIDLIHRSGGRAFLAHPPVTFPERERLAQVLRRLKDMGLDGVELSFDDRGEPTDPDLAALADELGLLASSGSDAHEAAPNGRGRPGVMMPTWRWKRFRDSVSPGAHPPASPGSLAARPQRLKLRHFALHIVCPTLLAMVLFAIAVFAVVLPAFGRALLDRKRETIRELTDSAWSILAEYEREERAGLLGRGEAQRLARQRIGNLRYGREGKDYFWIQDMHPRMVMHPYRQDLNGQDVSAFTDPRGARVFVEFAELVRRQNEGYVQYVWQWKDDPTRLEPKESYVKGFAPWGWIIGTGIYLEDVHQEIGRIQRHLVVLAVGICAVVAVLLLVAVHGSLSIERERLRTEEALRISGERYRSLVEATQEGILLVANGRCRYANPPLLDLMGYSAHELNLYDLADILPPEEANQLAWDRIAMLDAGHEPEGGFQGVLRTRAGQLIDCVLGLTSFDLAGERGVIVLVRDVERPGQTDEQRQAQRLSLLGSLADSADVGLFRARATGRGVLVEANPEAERLLGTPSREAGQSGSHLAELFPEPSLWEAFLGHLARQDAADCTLHLPGADGRLRTVGLRARLCRDESGHPRWIDGQVEDITERAARAGDQEALIERLQSSLLFLHEPVGRLCRGAATCSIDTPVRRVAALMTAARSSVCLVRAESGSVVGLVTDRDLRDRVLSASLDPEVPVHRVMTAPIVTITDQARVYEALLAMEERQVHHLAVTDERQQVVGVVHGQELLQFRDYGALVLTREISRAQSADEVIARCRRVPELAGALLGSGASPQSVTRMIAAATDAAVERFVDLAQQALGPLPGRFVFLALGSHGRQEQTLFSDQDNAIAYEETADAERDRQAGDYFAAMGRMVCGWLNDAGLAFCPGNKMANNPEWCQPVPVWRRSFHEWVRRAESKELLDVAVFFDLRAVAGDAELATELRQYVHGVVQATPAFLTHFAQNAQMFRPPLRLFGRIVGVGGEGPGHLNLKDAMMPIVTLARLYALRHGVQETHTLRRLEALVELNVLPEPSLEETAAAYDFLLRLRLRNQAEAIQAGHTPDNLVDHRRLGHLDRALLRQSLAQIAAIQQRISHDFLGDMSGT